MNEQSRLVTAARRALVCLDLTNLDDACGEADITDLCNRAQTEFGSVAAVCIWPRFVPMASGFLKNTGIKVATVVNFPTGNEHIGDVIDMTRTALASGADEIDLVAPYREFMGGTKGRIEDTTRTIKDVCGKSTLKVILETGELADEASIGLASEEALAGGADFLKTSTGKVPINATPEAASMMLKTISRLGSSAGFKAAGGVRSTQDAAVYLDLADKIMGDGWAGPGHFRFGASGVLAALLATLAGSEEPDTGGGY